jgi:N-carbamoylputrescine amidase
MFNTGYGLVPDYTPMAEDHTGPSLRYLAERSRQWNMTIAAGFVEREARHLYDSVVLVEPTGEMAVYRKNNLVFWERFRFYPGNKPVVVKTRFGRVGLAICADMIYKSTWAAYAGRIDLAVVSSAWPDFADRHTGHKHWLFGHVGPLSGAIPHSVAKDLHIPVIFANQCGETQTTIPILRTQIRDRFVGLSSITDGLHGPPKIAGTSDELLISEVTIHSATSGPRLCRSTSSSGLAVPFSESARS